MREETGPMHRSSDVKIMERS